MLTMIVVFLAGVSVGISLIGVLSLCAVAGREPPARNKPDPLDGWWVRR